MRHLLLLLALGVTSLPAEEGYYAKLHELTNGRDALTAKQRELITKNGPLPISEGLAGVKFGMSMQDVVQVWGKPKIIWMQDADITQITICNSNFTFKRDVLYEVAIHSSDLPKYSMMGGQIQMDEACKKLIEIFPGAQSIHVDIPEIDQVELHDELKVSVQKMENKVIAITVSRPQ